ncbi:hypothetical protein MAR_000113 [Mya arenaria]|uniref:BTB domain-containing protein n=1 Tax=Mya arenaria TaxID=6604 RepID=A0ABY7F7V5_MYAAR|nr:hypothetical protein MAR_000113 [Mya arenaria]
MSELFRKDQHVAQAVETDSNDEMESSMDEAEKANPVLDFTVKTWKDDVAFVVEKKQMYAAKVVLALASPVFEAMFGSEFTERYQNEVELPGKQFERISLAMYREATNNEAGLTFVCRLCLQPSTTVEDEDAYMPTLERTG